MTVEKHKYITIEEEEIIEGVALYLKESGVVDIDKVKSIEIKCFSKAFGRRGVKAKISLME